MDKDCQIGVFMNECIRVVNRNADIMLDNDRELAKTIHKLYRKNRAQNILFMMIFVSGYKRIKKLENDIRRLNDRLAPTEDNASPKGA